MKNYVNCLDVKRSNEMKWNGNTYVIVGIASYGIS